MRVYRTQMEAAKKGIVTPEMKIVAEKEGWQITDLMELMAKGQIVIPANPAHVGLDHNGIGDKLKT
ncbi:MAG: phosphomethylpyrimidine synthase ThiC [Lachnospiraceae bacterium]|nr:phosphomethylpyrimidine synthase ThiC [Lachnospiraceae bacterium]